MQANQTHSVCPWWLGYFLLNPLRKKRQDPHELLEHYINKDDQVLDYGSGMGYFSVPMAQLVGENGKVYCLDLQQKMLDGLMRRARKRNLQNIITPVLVTSSESSKIKGKSIDFALLFAVAHEVPDKEKLFLELYRLLKDDGLLLFAEPKGHVSFDDFERSVGIAVSSGFHILGNKEIWKSHAVMLQK